MIKFKNNKILENKEEKKNNLINSAFKLFAEKGLKNTSVSEITENAGVAKGTFYLYFKDKYDLQEYIITKKSKQLFTDAINSLNKKDINNYQDKVIYIIDYIIDQFIKNKLLLKLISKNLSWGLYNEKLSSYISGDDLGMKELFRLEIEKNNIELKDPDTTLFMIVELTSSTVFTTITTGKPISIDKFKPFLYDVIRKMLTN